MIENCSRSFEERDQEAEIEQIVLKELRRRMNPPVARVIEEMALEEVEDSKEEEEKESMSSLVMVVE